MIVTAASRGIGEGIARRLAADGYRLSLFSSSDGSERLADELGMLGMRGSVTEPTDLARLVDATLERYGQLNGLVVNAGILPSSLRPDGSAAAGGAAYDPSAGVDPCAITDQEWVAGFEMMFMPLQRLMRLCMPHFRVSAGGSVVAMSTFTAPEPRLAYPVSSAIRGGLAPLVKLHADAHARDGVRVNAVLPGFVANYAQTQDVINSIPLGRQAGVEEVAAVVAFLLSDDASYLTGQQLVVDGGANRSV